MYQEQWDRVIINDEHTISELKDSTCPTTRWQSLTMKQPPKNDRGPLVR